MFSEDIARHFYSLEQDIGVLDPNTDGFDKERTTPSVLGSIREGVASILGEIASLESEVIQQANDAEQRSCARMTTLWDAIAQKFETLSSEVGDLRAPPQSPAPSTDSDEIASLRREITSLTTEVKELRASYQPPTPSADKEEISSLRKNIASLRAEAKELRALLSSPAPPAKSRPHERVGRPSRPTTPPTRPTPPTATKELMSPPPTQSRATNGKRRRGAGEPPTTTDRESQPSPKGKRTRKASPTRGLGLSRHAVKEQSDSPQPPPTPPPASNRGWTKAGAKGQNGKGLTWAQIAAQPWARQPSIVVILGGEGRKPRGRSKRKKERPDKPRPDEPDEPHSLW
jgi:hypothetical protein